MKRAAAILVASLAWTACSTAGPGAPVPIDVGKAFTLRLGDVAQAPDGGLRIGFDAVPVDSRCPKGEQCITPGGATVRVWWQFGSGPKDMRELRAAPGAAQAVAVHDHLLRLVALAPYPVTGRVVAQADYAATLVLSRRPPDDTDR